MPTKTASKSVTKKAVKKSTKTSAEKAPTKSAKKSTRTPKKEGKFKALVCAQGKECFWTTDGTILQDLDQLQLALGTMDDEVFLHHVNKEKNDFADWIEHVLGDSECAKALRKAKKPSSAKTVVVRYLKTYKA